METFAEDTTWMLKHFGLDKITYPKGYNNPSSMELLNEQLENVPNLLPNSIYEYLQKDYKLFGYPKPEFVLGST